MRERKAEPIYDLDQEWTKGIRKNLLHWYDQNKRDLPWRKSRDPYRIWVSEIMLQQTRVDTVIPYYQRFMENFPTLIDLAEADEDEVLKYWEGLGYYSRARNLHAAVKKVATVYGGKVPEDLQTISQLKGIGAYTAGAVLSIAYNQPEPAVDGNVMRVFSRWFAMKDDVAKPATRRKMEAYALQVMCRERPGDFNQGLMELGALICHPLSPVCDSCPVNSLCQARQQGIQHELPVKKKAKPPVPYNVIFGYIKQDGHVLVQRRPQGGLLAGMWSLPTVEEQKKSSDALIPDLSKKLAEAGFHVEWGKVLGETDHIFSHRRWNITILEGKALSVSQPLPEEYMWVTEGSWDSLAFPKAYHKALRIADSRFGSRFQGSLF